MPPDDCEALERYFRERSRLVDGFPGFLYLQLLRDLDRDPAARGTDNGEGIAPDELPNVFEEFVRRGDAPGGTGLGLPIARRLAHLLDGELEVSSAVGVGSTFRLLLPREPRAG